jgi:hypothetical protein
MINKISELAAVLSFEFNDAGLKKFEKGLNNVGKWLKNMSSVAKQAEKKVNKNVGTFQKQANQASKAIQKNFKALKDKKVKLDVDYDKRKINNARTDIINIADIVKAKLAGNIDRNIIDMAAALETAGYKIKNFIDERQYDGIKKQIQGIGKASKGMFKDKDLELAAASYLEIDRNVNRLKKSMEYAANMQSILGVEAKEIMDEIAGGVMKKDASGLVQKGIIKKEDVIRLQKAGLSFAEMTTGQMEDWVFSRLELTGKQLKLSAKASQSFSSNLKRVQNIAKSLAYNMGQVLLPQLNYLMKKIIFFKETLKDTWLGKFGVKIITLGATLSGFVIAMLTVVTIMLKLKAAFVMVNMTTALLALKFMLIAAVVLGVIAVIEDLWLSLYHPGAKTVFNELLFNKFPALKDAIKNVIGFIRDLFNYFTGGAKWEDSEIFASMEKKFPLLTNIIKTVAKTFKEWISYLLGITEPAWIKNIIKNVPFIGTLIKGLQTITSKVFEKITAYMKNPVKVLEDIEAALTKVKAKYQEFIKWFTDKKKSLTEVIDKVGGWVGKRKENIAEIVEKTSGVFKVISDGMGIDGHNGKNSSMDGNHRRGGQIAGIGDSINNKTVSQVNNQNTNNNQTQYVINVGGETRVESSGGGKSAEEIAQIVSEEIGNRTREALIAAGAH